MEVKLSEAAGEDSMSKFKMLYVIGIILLAGCSATPALPTQIQIKPTPTVSEGIENLSTPVIPFTSNPSLSIPPEAHLSIACLEISQTVDSISNLKGSIVLAQEENPRQVFLWNAKNFKQELVSDTEKLIALGYSVSSDGKWLAYIQSDIDENRKSIRNFLVIMSSNGMAYKKIPVDIGMFISHWLDNERLILTRGLAPLGAQVVINPFTGMRQELKTDFPDMYNIPPTSNWEGQGVVVYDPSLSRVVYAGAPADIVLVDVPNNNIILRISPAPVVHSVPKWSSDGQQFVMTYADILNPINDPKNWTFELYSASRDGRFDQLTHLSAYYNHPRIISYKWSPDDRHIAFWLEPDPLRMGGIFNLAVLNMDTGNVTNYCITSASKGILPFFWSPNSEQLVVGTFDRKEIESSRVLLVDIKSGWAAQIAKNMKPVGWMVAP